MTLIGMAEEKIEDRRIELIKIKLDSIQREIGKYHRLKEGHRKHGTRWINRVAYFDLGIPHCEQCRMWTQIQNSLRSTRRMLQVELCQLEEEEGGEVQ